MNQEEIRIALNILKSYNPDQIQESLNEKLEKSIIDEDLFAKASEEVDIMKGGKRAVVGEKRIFGGREYIKTNDGWKFHGKGTGSKAQEHVAGSLQHHVQGATGEKKEESDLEDLKFHYKEARADFNKIEQTFLTSDGDKDPKRHLEIAGRLDEARKKMEGLQKEIEATNAKKQGSKKVEISHKEPIGATIENIGPGGKVTSTKDVSDKSTEVLGKQFGPKEADAAKEYMKQQAEKTGKRHRILLDSQKNFHVNDGTKEVSGMHEWTTYTPDNKESSFSAVKEWIGDQYTDSQIKSITDQLKEAGIENKELSIPRAESQELQSQAVDKRVNSLLSQLRPGMEHKDLDKYDVRDIIWGLIMSEYKIN